MASLSQTFFDKSCPDKGPCRAGGDCKKGSNRYRLEPLRKSCTADKSHYPAAYLSTTSAEHRADYATGQYPTGAADICQIKETLNGKPSSEDSCNKKAGAEPNTIWQVEPNFEDFYHFDYFDVRLLNYG